jgi:hypothetical protein
MSRSSSPARRRSRECSRRREERQVSQESHFEAADAALAADRAHQPATRLRRRPASHAGAVQERRSSRSVPELDSEPGMGVASRAMSSARPS